MASWCIKLCRNYKGRLKTSSAIFYNRCPPFLVVCVIFSTFLSKVQGFCGDSIKWSHNVNIEDVYGMWYGVGYAQHTPDMTNKPIEVGCVTLFIADASTELHDDWLDWSIIKRNYSDQNWRSDKSLPWSDTSIAGSWLNVRIKRNASKDNNNDKDNNIDKDDNNVQEDNNDRNKTKHNKISDSYFSKEKLPNITADNIVQHNRKFNEVTQRHNNEIFVKKIEKRAKIDMINAKADTKIYLQKPKRDAKDKESKIKEKASTNISSQEPERNAHNEESENDLHKRRSKRNIYNERRIKILWDEDGQSLEQTYLYTPEAPGLWVADKRPMLEREMKARGIEIWHPDNPPRHPQVIRILKLTPHSLTLNHCSDLGGGGIFSLILQRSPSTIKYWEWYNIKRQLFNFDLPNIYRYTTICAGCVGRSEVAVVLICLMIVVVRFLINA